MKTDNIKNVLIVDDSATMRMLISLSIRKIMDSIRITEAENGLTALSRMKQQDFDLVFTDMQMPEMDGGSLIQRIREQVSKDLPVIIITTQGEEHARDLGLATGANGYLIKPVKTLELRETVMRYLGRN
jgi:two-component system, chemotaxis family, chemotaxis protein CheY